MICKWKFVGSILILLMVAGFATRAKAEVIIKKKPLKVLMVGGGSSHDFDRWYKQEDVATLERDGLALVTYTDEPSKVLALLGDMDVLFLANNQPFGDGAIQDAIMAFTKAGKGLILAHPAIWYNWKEWPEYNQMLVGGGSRGHDAYGPFLVRITDSKHPVTKGVPNSFKLDDELYYFKVDPNGSAVTVLATAQAKPDGPSYPSVFTVQYGKGKILGLALGHDAASHTLDAYQTLIRNAVKWVSK